MRTKSGENVELLSSDISASSVDGNGESNDQLPKHRKLNVPIVVLMIIGKIVGSGLMLLPIALSDTGWLGFIVLGFCFATSAFTGVLLARSWLVLIRWFPAKYKDEINRHPYPSISYEAFGVCGRRVTAFLIGCYCFGFSVAMYLLVADSVQLFFQLFHIQFPLCSWIAIVVIFSAPLLWFGTPKDMIVAGIASGSTSLFVFLSLVIGSLLDIGAYPTAGPIQPTFFSVSGALGLIMTSFSGQVIIPTIQHDMRKPEDMQLSAVLGYLGIGCIYTILGLVSFFVYGNMYSFMGADSILDLIKTEALQIVAIAFLAFHLFVAVIFLSNPLFQDLENYFNIPYEFTWKRVLLRTIFSFIVLCVGMSVPSFSIYLSVIGGALAAVVNGILPSVVYLKLSSMEPPPGGKPEGPLKWYSILIIVCVILLSAIGGLLSSIAGFYNMFNTENNSTLPCFIQPH